MYCRPGALTGRLFQRAARHLSSPSLEAVREKLQHCRLACRGAGVMAHARVFEKQNTRRCLDSRTSFLDLAVCSASLRRGGRKARPTRQPAAIALAYFVVVEKCFPLIARTSQTFGRNVAVAAP